MKISARNVIKGAVKKITTGAVNSEVIIKIPGKIEIVSVVTNESVATLGLAVGKSVYAIVKASNVIIATD